MCDGCSSQDTPGDLLIIPSDRAFYPVNEISNATSQVAAVQFHPESILTAPGMGVKACS